MKLWRIRYYSTELGIESIDIPTRLRNRRNLEWRLITYGIVMVF